MNGQISIQMTKSTQLHLVIWRILSLSTKTPKRTHDISLMVTISDQSSHIIYQDILG